MNIQSPDVGVGQLRAPEKPKPAVPEVKAKEKPLGQTEQVMVNLIKKDGGVHMDGDPKTGNPDQILKEIASETRVETLSTESTKTPYEQFMEDSGDKTEIIGGEIISPVAVRVPNQEKGETSDQVRKEAETGGWLSAITNAKGSPGNVQEIVNAAKSAGVPKEAIKAHLESLGIKVTEAEATGTPQEQAAKPAQSTLEQALPIDETRINGYLGEIAAQGRLAIKGILKPEEVQRMVDEAKAAGVPLDQIETTLKGVGIAANRKTEKQPSQPDASKISPQESQLSSKKEDPELALPSGKRVSWIRYGGGKYDNKLDENGNFHLSVADAGNMSTVLSRPRIQPFTSEDAADDTANSWGIHIPPEIDNAAYFAETTGQIDENGDPIYYADFVGKKMGWIDDGVGGWIIPASQIEKITNKKAASMAQAK